MVQRVNIVIRGQVQGVFFRASTREQAQRLNLIGFVQNLEDGSVNAVAQGNRENLLELIEWCHEGPEMAQVDEVTVKYEPIQRSENNFQIIS